MTARHSQTMRISAVPRPMSICPPGTEPRAVRVERSRSLARQRSRAPRCHGIDRRLLDPAVRVDRNRSSVGLACTAQTFPPVIPSALWPDSVLPLEGIKRFTNPEKKETAMKKVILLSGAVLGITLGFSVADAYAQRGGHSGGGRSGGGHSGGGHSVGGFGRGTRRAAC